MLLDDKTKLRLAAVIDRLKREARQAPFILFVCGLLSLVFLGCTGLEYEVLYRLFDYLAGEDKEDRQWSPTLMAFASFSMIVGSHLLAKERPDNIAVRFVTRTTQVLIPFYILGVGLIIAGMIMDSAPGDMGGLDLGSASEGLSLEWIETLFTSLASPLSTVLFSLGIGGLAIVNLYVAHKLLTHIGNNLFASLERLHNYRAVKADYDLALQCDKNYTQNDFDLGDFEQFDDAFIAQEQSAIVLNVIDESLAPHEDHLKDHQLATDPGQFPASAIDRSVDLKQLEKLINKIKAISQEDIIEVMLPATHSTPSPKPPEKKR